MVNVNLIFGVSTAIQSLQNQAAAHNIYDLLTAVETALEEPHPSKFWRHFLDAAESDGVRNGLKRRRRLQDASS